jgi:hypothetical protein
MTRYLLGTAVILFLAITSCKPKANTSDTEQEQPKISQENPYEGLRKNALHVSAEELDIQIPDTETRVYGIVMDWDQSGDGVATVVAFETGDASMYSSSGGAVIGGGQDDNVVKAVARYISKGQGYLDKATKTEATPLPDKDCIRFYLKTNKGMYATQETMTNMENGTSPWLSLFEEANVVLAELRIASERK